MLIKANRIEALGVATPKHRPLAMARSLADEHRCSVVVTYGRHGMVCAERSVAVRYLPATPAEVRDVCGAGDTVLATLGVAIARGAALREACAFAVKAAAKQVSRFGIAPIRHAA
jgi:D-beta-D-heptose 7-phosphate kinase/D-beta-D-heptose 1-phosphate adenosyltransferase